MQKYLILATLVAFSICIAENDDRQGSFLTYEFPEQLQKTHFGKVIIDMISLASNLRDVDPNDLLDSLEKIADAVQIRREEEMTLFNEEKIEYLADQDFYEKQKIQYNNEVAQHKVDIDGLKSVQESLEDTIGRKKSELATTITLADGLQSSMVSSEDQYKGQLESLIQAITALDNILVALEEVDTDSFVQISQTQVQQVENSLSSQSSRRILIKPLINALVQLSTSKFEDVRILMDVKKFLNKIRADLVHDKLALMDNYARELATNEKLLSGYTEKISLLGKVIIPENQTELSNVIDKIDTKQKILDDATGNYNRASDNFDENEKRWLARQAQNKKIVDSYDSQLQQISESLVALQRNGIRRED